MKCRNCDADLAEGTLKCPFCKELLDTSDNSIFDNYNFKYTINPEDQVKMIKNASNHSKKPLSGILKRRLKRRKKIVLHKKSNKHSQNKREHNDKKRGIFPLSPQNKMYVFFYGGILFLVLLVTGIFFAVGAIVNRERVIEPIVYTKENSMYLLCDNKNVLLTENTVDMNSVFSSLADGETVKLADVMQSENLVKNSENGMYTYYFENYDAASDSGSLNRIFNGRDKRAVSNNVHNSYILSPDGKSVLFLQSADENGDMGSLCYWNEDLEEPVRIASDIDKNTFVFSADGNYILYIRNYNYSSFGGDLCVVNVKNIEEESIVIDSEVYAVFGSDINENRFIYAKGFDDLSNTYDLYIKSEKSERVRIFEGAAKTPILPEKGNILITYAYGDGHMYSLHSVNLKNFDKIKIASQATDVLKTDEKNETVLYNKVYENYITDCYLYTKGNKTIKAAENITPVSAELAGINQFSYNDDLTSSVYISAFDENRFGGTLYIADLNKESENTVEISKDVYMCRISSDGKKVIYAKDYNSERDIFDLYAYSKNESVLIKEEVDASYFKVSKNRENYFIMENYEMTGPYGTLKIMNSNNKEKAAFENVWAYDSYGEEGVIFFTDFDAAEETWTIQTNNGNSKKSKVVGNGIDAVLYY